MSIDRVLTPDEKLRRAEELYYSKRVDSIRKRNKTINVPISNQKYLLKKMIIQILICFIIYASYYLIKNFNFIFSDNVINKTNEILSYDINIQDVYCKIANYINNQSFFKENNGKEDIPIEGTEEFVKEDNENATDNNVSENEIIVNTSSNVEAVKEIETAENNLNQMQLDAIEIKEKYSLINPLNGQITSRFGVREKTQDVISSYHVGLDIAANTGTPICASLEGNVVYSGDLDGYGNCIQIQKDDILTIYGHCSKLHVNVGDNIIQGQHIADVGQTGNTTGAHLHFEIRKSGRYVDPELIL